MLVTLLFFLHLRLRQIHNVYKYLLLEQLFLFLLLRKEGLGTLIVINNTQKLFKVLISLSGLFVF
jgi:hypothetical protein